MPSVTPMSRIFASGLALLRMPARSMCVHSTVSSLTDFGIAAVREATALTATGSVIGTPDYMAPERISGTDGGPASDLWSLAMMLYAAVEGHNPLRRHSTLATLAAVLHEEVPPPVISGPLADVLMCVLVRDPMARPDPVTLDRMLADVAEGREATTSYRLPPPSSGNGPELASVPPGFGPPPGYPTPQDAIPVPVTQPTGGSVAPGFGPPPGYPTAQDAIPVPAAQPTGRPVRRPRRPRG